MALCKEIGKVRASGSTVFDAVVRPGAQVRYEGIYRCTECHVEIAAIGGKPLRRPERLALTPCAHSEWRLLVALGG